MTAPLLRPLAAALLLALATPLAAQEAAPAEDPEAPAAPSLALELNDATSVEGGCQLTFLARNGLGADLSALSLETVILTVEGQVERLTLFDFRDLPQSRPRVRQFVLEGLDCAALGQVLVNGVSSCQGEGIEPGACLGGLSLSSRIEAEMLG
jgi:hypothetical protein